MQFYVFFIVCFYTFLFDLGKYVNLCEKISFSSLSLSFDTCDVIFFVVAKTEHIMYVVTALELMNV